MTAMAVVRQSIVVEAPPEDVWRVIADPRNLPRWNSHIRAVHDVPDGGLRPGSRYVTEVRFMGVSTRVPARVVELQPHRYSEVMLSGPVDAVVRTYLHPVGKGSTEVEHEVHYRFRGGPLGSLAARAVSHLGASAILRRGLRAQKEQVETG